MYYIFGNYLLEANRIDIPYEDEYKHSKYKNNIFEAFNTVDILAVICELFNKYSELNQIGIFYRNYRPISS